MVIPDDVAIEKVCILYFRFVLSFQKPMLVVGLGVSFQLLALINVMRTKFPVLIFTTCSQVEKNQVLRSGCSLLGLSLENVSFNFQKVQIEIFSKLLI